jgi:hypothetical protein
MATITTFIRARPADSTQAVASQDLTPSALGRLGSIVVTENPAIAGGASVAAREDAYSWTGVLGASIDPRTGRPFRAAPWVPAWPTDLLSLATERPLSAYMSTSATTYDGLVAAVASLLGRWGWTTETETV